MSFGPRIETVRQLLRAVAAGGTIRYDLNGRRVAPFTRYTLHKPGEPVRPIYEGAAIAAYRHNLVKINHSQEDKTP